MNWHATVGAPHFVCQWTLLNITKWCGNPSYESKGYRPSSSLFFFLALECIYDNTRLFPFLVPEQTYYLISPNASRTDTTINHVFYFPFLLSFISVCILFFNHIVLYIKIDKNPSCVEFIYLKSFLPQL